MLNIALILVAIASAIAGMLIGFDVMYALRRRAAARRQRAGYMVSWPRD